jgi:hypothetical protein
MTTSYKTVNGDYTITCNDGDGIFTVNAQTVFSGNVTYTVPAISVAPFLTVAANNTGAITDGGLLMQTGPTTFSGFRFDTTANVWQVSSSVTSLGVPIAPYSNLGSPGGSTATVQFNQNGVFNGSTAFTFNNVSNAVSIGGALNVGGVEVLSNIGTPPTAVANSVSIYNNAPGSGQTGLYVTGNTIATDEVISLTRAKLYSIIF